MGKSAANDAHDGDDDELQRFSKGVRYSPMRSRNGAMCRKHGKHKCDKEHPSTIAVYIFPNISPCSHSSQGGHDAPAVSYVAVGPIKLWHHASKASRFSSRSPSARSASRLDRLLGATPP